MLPRYNGISSSAGLTRVIFLSLYLACLATTVPFQPFRNQTGLLPRTNLPESIFRHFTWGESCHSDKKATIKTAVGNMHNLVWS